MTKKLMTILAVPLACLGLGYGAGIYILSSSSAEASPAPMNQGEKESGDVQAHGAETQGHGDAGHGATGNGETGHTKRAASATETKIPGNVLRLGRMTVPVYRATTVTYVVADMGLSLETAARAQELRTDENFVKVRAAVLASMTEAAQEPVLGGASIDTEALSDMVLQKLKAQFSSVEEVLFLDFYKQDVARS